LLPRVTAAVAQPPPRRALPEPSALAAMAEPARLRTLIEHLDEIRLTSHGWGAWEDARFIPELTKIGAAAIDPLIPVLESDPRVTRTVYAVEQEQHLAVLGVEEAAQAAIGEILARTFTAGLRARGPNARKERAAEIRAYWSSWRGVTAEERWYRLLADDAADPHDQVMAALQIVQPTRHAHAVGVLRGDVLRGHAPPSVATLLERRMDTAADLDHGCYFARTLVRWDAQAAPPALARLTARAIAEAGTSDRNGSCIADLAKLRADLGDLGGVDAYAHWLARVVPGDWVSPLVYKSLSEFRTRPSVVQALDAIFRAGSPWLPLADPTSTRADVSELLQEDLLAHPAVNRHAVLALADRRAYGTVEMLDPLRYVAKPARGGGLESVIEPAALHVPPQGTRHTLRVCDWIAYRVTWLRSGVPRFEMYWSEPRRDAAIAALVNWLQAQRRP
ncbi:MAG: hypothetical protein KIT31_04960, partial [Deltaproteobacteria bacterium]|nr:hypothetical protein [Deltaproteobacteria bacterium]